MNTPLSFRKGIPFFYNKTETEFQNDQYERYDSMVVRQSVLHLADELWGHYLMQAVFDFAKVHYPTSTAPNILEIGCGVGRWIGTLAQHYPAATCWGIDYSYQMLKRAFEFWIDEATIELDITNMGFPNPIKVQGHQLDNLHLGLAKAEQLPFSDNSQDLVLNSFLIDRLENPAKGLEEMHRVLKPSGRLIIITPLNFNRPANWATYYSPARLQQLLIQIGFKIIEWQENILIHYPLDIHGNMVTWNCLGFVVNKKVG